MKKTLFIVVLGIAFLGCANNEVKKIEVVSKKREAQTISSTNIFSSFESDVIEYSRVMGNIIFTTDRISGIASDDFVRLRSKGEIKNPEEIKGWLTYAINKENYNVECIFIGEDKESKPYISYRYEYGFNERKGKGTVCKEKEYLEGNTLAMYKARQLALKSKVELIASSYNPVVIRTKEGIAVYLLSATNKSNNYVLGGHYKILVSDNGEEILNIKKYSNSVIESEIPKNEENLKVEGVLYLNNTFPYPTELNVFESLNYRIKLLLCTNNKIWEVEGMKIKFLENIEKENIKEDKLIDNQNVEKINYENQRALVKKEGKWGYVDRKGNLVIECKYKYATDFSEGLAAVKIDNKWGFIDKDGKIIIEPQYEFAEEFKEGLAPVKINTKKGFIDKVGKFAIEAQYEDCGHFKNGIAKFRKNKLYGFINREGKIISEAKYNLAWDFNEGLAAVKENDKWGYINESGEKVIDCEYSYVNDFKEGLAAVKKEKYYGFIDKKGKMVIDDIFASAEDFNDGLAGIGIYVENNSFKKRFGFVNKDGNIMLVNENIFGISAFSEGYARVKIDNNFGYIDATGEILIEGIFEDAKKFRNGFACIKKDGKWGFIDKTGKIIIPLEYSDCMNYSE